jgi:hypothetical protein
MKPIDTALSLAPSLVPSEALLADIDFERRFGGVARL